MTFWPFILIIIIMVLSIVAVGETNNQVNYLQMFSNIGTLLAACAAWYSARLSWKAVNEQINKNKNEERPFFVSDEFREYELKNVNSPSFDLNWDTGLNDLSGSSQGSYLKIYNVGNGHSKNIKIELFIENQDEFIKLLSDELYKKKGVALMYSSLLSAKGFYGLSFDKKENSFHGGSHHYIASKIFHEHNFISNIEQKNYIMVSIPKAFMVLYNAATVLLTSFPKNKEVWPILNITISGVSISGRETVKRVFKMKLKGFEIYPQTKLVFQIN